MLKDLQEKRIINQTAKVAALMRYEIIKSHISQKLKAKLKPPGLTDAT